MRHGTAAPASSHRGAVPTFGEPSRASSCVDLADLCSRFRAAMLIKVAQPRAQVRHVPACACTTRAPFELPRRTCRVGEPARHCIPSTPAGSPRTRSSLGTRWSQLVGPMLRRWGVKVRGMRFVGAALGRNTLRRLRAPNAQVKRTTAPCVNIFVCFISFASFPETRRR